MVFFGPNIQNGQPGFWPIQRHGELSLILRLWIKNYQCVGIEEDALPVLGQPPAM